MVKKYLFILATLFSFNGLAMPSVYAVEDTNTNSSTSETTGTETTDTSDKSSTSNQDTERKLERLESYKQKLTEKIESSKSKRIAARCESAQGKITSLQARVNQIVENRKKVYKELGEKLDKLVLKLQASGVDTTELETARDDAKSDLQNLNEELDNYIIVLSDLESMDCVSDPDAFWAALSEARELQKQIRQDASDFRSFVTNEIRTIIGNLKSKLESLNSNSESQ